LRTVCSNVRTVQRNIYHYGESLGSISDLYVQAEKGLDLKPVKQGTSQQPGHRTNYGVVDTFDKTAVRVTKKQDKRYGTWDDFFESLPLDMFQTVVDKGTWPILTSLFKKGIIKSSKTLLKFNSVLGYTGNIGLPVIGGIIDAASMMKSGEGAVNSIIKATVHAGVGWYAGSTCAGLGAVVGSSIGSVVPGLGTAIGGIVGAGVGLLAGSLSTTVINGALDMVYDQVYSPYVDKAVDGVVYSVKKVGGSVVKAGKSIANGIGCAFRTGTGWIGSVFG
jgi:hypothetical protein